MKRTPRFRVLCEDFEGGSEKHGSFSQFITFNTLFLQLIVKNNVLNNLEFVSIAVRRQRTHVDSLLKNKKRRNKASSVCESVKKWNDRSALEGPDTSIVK